MVKIKIWYQDFKYGQFYVIFFSNQCEICQGFFPDVIQYKDDFSGIDDFIKIDFDSCLEFEILKNNDYNNDMP